VASISTCETAARNRETLLTHFHAYRKTAIEEGSREPVREYILPRRGDVSLVDKLARLLAFQGVEVKCAAAEFTNAGKTYPAGSYVVGLAQPAKRLVRTLLDPAVPMDKPFLDEQERRRRKRLPDEIYDVTAWSLPLLYNVECIPVAAASTGNFALLAAEEAATGRVEGGAARLAYLAPWGTVAAGRLLARALRESLVVRSTDKAFRQGERKYPAGTLIFLVKENPAGLDARLRALAAETGAGVVAVDSGWVDEGPNFGSEYVVRLRRPGVAVVWDRPLRSGSAGAVRFVLERQFGYPVTAIRASVLGMADLSRFQVLIVPEGGQALGAMLGPNGIRRLKDWVSGGGTLIALGGSTTFLTEPAVGLLAIAQENLARAGEEEKKKPEAPPAGADARVPGKLLASEADWEKAIQPERALPDSVAGVLLRARTDPDNWLMAGAAETVLVPVSGREIYTPIKKDKGVNAASFLAADRLLASGYLWEENRKQLAFKPFVVVQSEGRGNVIAFTADPNFRAFSDGLNVLLLNAVFRGPAHARGFGFGAE
jgi:hypothetical protein